MRRLAMTYAAHVHAAIRASTADRGSAWLQGCAMALNNGFVLAMWFLFFAGFRSVGGWRMPDMALLNALLAAIVGLGGILAGGYRDMARQIVTGVPDMLLTQPKAVLPRLLASESNVSGWGDIVTALILFLTVAGLRWSDAGWVMFVLLCGLVVFLSTATAFASIAFWARGARSFARDLTDFLVTFSFYPGSIYQGQLKLVVYTLFPAAFIVLIPVELVRRPNFGTAAFLGAASIGYAALAVLLFTLGLRRYRRGESPGAE
ncbi:MAG: ABC-2 family transporter protein [Sphingobium sp.]